MRTKIVGISVVCSCAALFSMSYWAMAEEPLDSPALPVYVVEHWESEFAAIEKEIGLRNTIEKGLSVYADKDMIEMVLRNLTGNALKFTPRGGTVTLAAKIKNNNGNGHTRRPKSHFVEVAVTIPCAVGIMPIVGISVKLNIIVSCFI